MTASAIQGSRLCCVFAMLVVCALVWGGVIVQTIMG